VIPLISGIFFMSNPNASIIIKWCS
jgi:hypothetical protein